MALRSSFTVALAALSLASIAAAAGCSGAQESEEPIEASEGALTLSSCSRPSVPDTLKGLDDMKPCQLQALFDNEDAKRATKAHGIPVGAYEGVPLCRKEVLRQISTNMIPPNVRDLNVGPLLKLLSISDTIDNFVAGEVWHGKHFTPDAQGAIEGDVNNYIDVLARGIGEDTRRSAEARYFIDPQQDWLVLNYKDASSGLRGLKHFSVNLIRQVYDTARLVDADKGIWVGMAWMVNQPGTFDERDTASYIPSCYFALKKMPEAAASKDDKK